MLLCCLAEKNSLVCNVNEMLQSHESTLQLVSSLAKACLYTKKPTKLVTKYLDLNNVIEYNLSKRTGFGELF